MLLGVIVVVGNSVLDCQAESAVCLEALGLQLSMSLCYSSTLNILYKLRSSCSFEESARSRVGDSSGVRRPAVLCRQPAKFAVKRHDEVTHESCCVLVGSDCLFC